MYPPPNKPAVPYPLRTRGWFWLRGIAGWPIELISLGSFAPAIAVPKTNKKLNKLQRGIIAFSVSSLHSDFPRFDSRTLLNSLAFIALTASTLINVKLFRLQY
uniref:Uncharacterized protein n=2 Tax=Cacopsylla melanoneura TaxID=428564 RepID=A0A8D8Q1F1_9HEMI